MLALSPTLFSTFGWSCLEDPINEDQSYNFRDSKTPESVLHIPADPDQQEIGLHHSASFKDDVNMVKKLNHNASERDRRKKINTLYSDLRSLLPATDQKKKLSIPATVSRVVKYIPELQHQVQRLIQKKEELLSKIPKQHHSLNAHLHQEEDEDQRKGTMRSSSVVVSASPLTDREVMVQISVARKIHDCPLSAILRNLEEDRLVLLSSSSFESVGNRVFYNLHLQAKEGTDHSLEFEALSVKLVSLYEKGESLL